MCPLSPVLFNIVFGSPCHSNQRRRRKIQIGKEEAKLSLFEGNMILYTENLKVVTRKLLEIVKEFNKSAGNKIHTQKLLHFYIP